MKNKGFTLIETLVVIALLAAVSVTIGVNMSGMLSKQNESKIEEYEETIANAGCVWAEVNNNKSDATVLVSTLVSEGYLKKSVNNPTTNESVSKDTGHVVITWQDNERKCSYSAS